MLKYLGRRIGKRGGENDDQVVLSQSISRFLKEKSGGDDLRNEVNYPGTFQDTIVRRGKIDGGKGSGDGK